MTNVRCAKCSVEIVPGTNFCRSCGAPVEPSPQPSELQTALLDESMSRTTTKRFEPRTTSEAEDAEAVRNYCSAASAGTADTFSITVMHRRPRPWLVVVGLIVMAMLAAGALFRIVQRVRRSASPTMVSQQLHYPGANTIVNVGDTGGAALQIETSDPIDKVVAWYEANLKPTTTMRIKDGVVIMRNDKITATIASNNPGTSIVIKQSAP